MRIARLTGIGVSLLLAACGEYVPEDEPDAQTVAQCISPTPPTGADPMTPEGRNDILAYARTLRFHPEQPPTGETRQLTVIVTPPHTPPGGKRYALGPEARVASEWCAHENQPADLASGAGRVVARINSSAAYPSLKLPQGQSFLWVDQLDSAATTARAVIIPNQPVRQVETMLLRIMWHHDDMPANWNVPQARWVFDPRDDDLWVTCVTFGCCVMEAM